MQDLINKNSTTIFNNVVGQNHQSTYNSLPLKLQKQLIIDIVKTGDHGTAPLRLIRNNRPHLYGSPDSKQQKRIQNKLHWWKKYDDPEFANLFAWLIALPCNILEEQSSPNTASLPQKQPTTKSTMSNFESHPPYSISGLVATSTVGAPYRSTEFSDCCKYCLIKCCC